MSLRERTQRRAFDRQLNRLGRNGSEEERAFVASMTPAMQDDLYQLSLERFIATNTVGAAVIGYDESQTPILDKLIEFFQWLWESGALLELIKLFFGGLMSEANTEVMAFYAAQPE